MLLPSLRGPAGTMGFRPLRVGPVCGLTAAPRLALKAFSLALPSQGNPRTESDWMEDSVSGILLILSSYLEAGPYRDKDRHREKGFCPELAE